MRCIICSVCLVLTVLTVAAAQAEGTAKCQRYRLASLKLDNDLAARPTIEAVVNGEKLQMLIDTGAIDSALDWKTVERMKLPKNRLEIEARVYDVAGTPVKYRTSVDEFHIGAMFGKNWPFLVMAENSPAGTLPGLDGILGPDILAQYDIEFDFVAGKFNIFTHDDCPGRVVYWSMEPYGALPFTMDNGYHIVAHAKLDGKDIDVMFDTGSSKSIMTDKVASEIGLDPAGISKADVDFGNIHVERKYRAKTLDLNGFSVQNLDFYILPEKNAVLDNMGRHRPTVIFGVDTLKQLHPYIAYREKVIYFTPADAR